MRGEMPTSPQEVVCPRIVAVPGGRPLAGSGQAHASVRNGPKNQASPAGERLPRITLFVRGHRTMRCPIILMAALMGFPFADRVLGGQSPGSRVADARHAGCCAATACCAEHYCKKPLPSAACAQCCGTADVYCKKPLPCVARPQACGCPDVYCKKPLPDPCVSRLWPFYRCPPCACESASRAGEDGTPSMVPRQPKPASKARPSGG